MQKGSESVKVVQLSAVKLDHFLKLLGDLARDEHAPHHANILYDDHSEHYAANQRAKESLREHRAG